MAASSNSTSYIATRGSELALKQANTTLAQLKKLFPKKQFDYQPDWNDASVQFFSAHKITKYQ